MLKIINHFKKKQKFKLKSVGYSMYPVLFPSDILHFSSVAFSRLKVGDIILVQKNKSAFIHSIVYRSKTYIITKGTNNSSIDGKSFRSEVIAKVVRITRKGTTVNVEDTFLFQSTLYLNEINDCVSAFDKNSLNYLILKGLPLHLFFEKKHPNRIYTDCDILIDKRDYTKVDKLLTKKGFKKKEDAFTNVHRILKQKETEINYIKWKKNYPINFDVHFEPVFLMNQLGRLEALYPQKLLDQMTKEFLETKQLITIQNHRYPILNVRYLIPYLCLHFFHHNYRGAFRLKLLDRIIRSDKKSHQIFEKVQKDIIQYKIKNFVYPTFILLKKLYGTPIPDDFLKSIRPLSPTRKYLSPILNQPFLVFNDETRIQAGINRFKNIFFLSEELIYKKILILLYPSVLYSVFWSLSMTVIMKLRLSFWRLSRSKAR